MNLDDAQKQKVAGWLNEGLKLSEIQSRLARDLGVQLSYLEVRLLIDDLKLKPKDIERPKQAAPVVGAGKPSADSAGRTAPGLEEGEEPEEQPALGGAKGVSVTVDHVARPGALVSGKVKFSDGKTADWYLDQFGRLGVTPAEQGYKPSQADVLAFQAELEKQMAKLGAL